MKGLLTGIIAFALLMSTPRMAMGQVNTTSGMRVETGVVAAIDASAQRVTLRKADGTMVTAVAGPEIERFREIKVGDTITARVCGTIVLRLKWPGEPEVALATRGTTGSDQAMPEGTTGMQVTVTVTITAIDPNMRSITFTGPEGWKYTSKVQDTEALAKLKVGDNVDIIWTEALVVLARGM